MLLNYTKLSVALFKRLRWEICGTNTTYDFVFMYVIEAH